MANILRVTTPVVGYDAASQTRANQIKSMDPAVQGQVNLDKVVRTDARTDANAQENNVGLKFQYESNYGSFIRQIQDSPVIVEELASLLLRGKSASKTLAADDPYTQKILEFLKMIPSSPEELRAMLKGQNQAAVKYSGAFFSILRQIMDSNSDLEAKASVMEFLRRYTDQSETPHMMENIKHLLENIKEKMYPDGRAQLEELLQNFAGGATKEEVAQNLDLLKGKVLPFLNLYVSRTNDRGNLRDLIVMLASYTGRCENGTPQRVQDALQDLMRYNVMNQYFTDVDTSALMAALQNTDYQKINKKQQWMQVLVSLLSDGIEGKAGSEQRALFQKIAQSILLNESVYMPLLHTMIPIQMQDRLMFAEMWVDPDARGDGSQAEQERMVQCLVKFHIEELGSFDLYFNYQRGELRMQIHCPNELKAQKKQITEDLTKMIAEHGLNAKELFVETNLPAISLTEAFPKLLERKNSVNVRI